MKITIERVGGGPVKFSEFADSHGLEIVVRERDIGYPENVRFYASFKRVDIKVGCMLGSEYGNGRTPENAIEEYARKLRGHLIVVSAMDPAARREIRCPNEWLPEDA